MNDLKITNRLRGPLLRVEAAEREDNRRHLRAALRDLITTAEQVLKEKPIARSDIPQFLRKTK